MSNQRRHTVSGAQPNNQDAMDIKDGSSSAALQADHNMDDGTAHMRDSNVDMDVAEDIHMDIDMAHTSPPAPAPLTGDNNTAMVLWDPDQSRSNEMDGMTEAFKQLRAGDEARPYRWPDARSSPITQTPSNSGPSNLRSDTRSNSRPDTPYPTTPAAAKGWYNLRKHLPPNKYVGIRNDIDPAAFERFVDSLTEYGSLKVGEDGFSITPVDRVLIMALAFHGLADPNELKLPSDVIDT